MDDEKIQELEAMLVVLRKMIYNLTNNSSNGGLNTDKQWLAELKKEASKIKN
ncbi:hypothetical protein K5L04_09475 [Flavobacterium psychrophilum]|uniref:hypothetical protein n=1 Tax=Flavobacterium psychrophilum TaxID=96345 RepID=UPI000B7C4BDC|nr:hypothetical protein [Flavobacterium psychrophilum]ELY1979201.1 hypothetical protein [Flavobacterium psychrophilum]MBF2092581.1 hypothetical protein [Flavobacterium psychrophilum]MEB3380722.1 hypothetical protein [Flavobacterium psychrophilum]QZK99926.1 hypothetical protein K5L04_09475 [Flavobacterium psychrophilum]SNA87625.1 hypothetical protein DK095_70028 [Flavobacterium psychrophilum]